MDSNVGTVNLTIAPVNDAPVAAADSATGNQGTTITGNVLTNDTDVDAGTTLTAALATGPANGTLTLNANGSFSYTPAGQFQRSGQLYVSGQRRHGRLTLATVSLTVNAVNTAPLAVNDSGGGNEDTPITGNVLDVPHRCPEQYANRSAGCRTGTRHRHASECRRLHLHAHGQLQRR